MKIAYWVITGLIAALLAFGSVFNVMSSPEAVELISHKLGYPAYLIPFLGVAKLLGCVVILIPGLPRLKEWAYAGLIFDLIGAMYSHIAIAAPVSEWAPLVVPIGLLIASYVLYHKLYNNR